jgi:integrase
MIKLRYKALKSRNYSLYLDIWSSDNHGIKKRQYEFLKLQVSKNYSKHKNILAGDKDTMMLAEEIRKRKELELAANIRGLTNRRITTDKDLVEYIEEHYLKTGNVTTQSILFHLRKHLGESRILLSAVNKDWLEGFKRYLLGEVSSNGARNYLKKFKARLNDAVRNELITSNPLDLIQLPAQQEVEKVFLQPDEVEKLISTTFPSHPDLRLGFLFSCFTGLRVSDIRNLKWEDLSNEKEANGSITTIMKIKPIKTEKEFDKTIRVPLTDSAVNILDLTKATFKGQAQKEDLVFDHLPSDRNARSLLKLWIARSGIKKNVSFHTARHTFATLCLFYGIDIYSTSKLLGHSSVRITEDYAKIMDKKKQSEILKLPEL